MVIFVMVLRWVGMAALGLALSACSEVGFDLPARQFSGVWLYEFEGSTFVEGATEAPAQRPAYKETDWLDYPIDWEAPTALVDAPYDQAGGCYAVQPFRIAFVGRRTYRPFGAGHLGLWRSDVTVLRMIALERLGPAFCYGG